MTKLLALLAVVLAACGSGGGSTINTDMSSQQLTLRKGEKATLTDPSYSPGIGDSWTVVTEPDNTVATMSSQLRDCDEPGCTGELDHVITATGTGTTTVTLQYCYRSAPPDCRPEPGATVPAPVVVTVTVG